MRAQSIPGIEQSSRTPAPHWGSGELEAVVCPLCGPARGVLPRFSFDPFRVVECRNCGLRFLSPRLTQASNLGLYQGEAYYRSTSQGRGYDQYLGVKENWRKTFAGRLRLINRYRSSGRVLDVGCGPGFFLEVAAEMGYEPWGVDPSDYIVRVAQKQFGKQILEGTIETVDLPLGSFDIIGVFDTFEHIYDPLAFLDRASQLLTDDGILAITTPNTASPLALISGKRWVSLKIPEHVFYWSPKTITRAMADRFKIMEIRRAGQYATLGFLFGRLFGLRLDSQGPMKAVLKLLHRASIYSDNGSMTVIAAKK